MPAPGCSSQLCSSSESANGGAKVRAKVGEKVGSNAKLKHHDSNLHPKNDDLTPRNRQVN